jgi:23S rRNA (cytosine1962-C5)-methyltransferase
MSDAKLTMFANRLTKVYKHRSKLAQKQGISCYRLYDLDMPEFPFCVDFYGHHLYIAEYKRNHVLTPEEHSQWRRNALYTMSETLNVDPTNIHLKERKIIETRTEQYEKIEKEKIEITVEENENKFIVNLSEYLDTGLFLDHRLTRKIVQEMSTNKCVLNLFAYTGSFSVYAAKGGASEVTTIDLSNTYIDWAKRNFELNGFNHADHKFIVGDVLGLLPTLPNAGYDIIICDPPTFSNSKKMKSILDIQRDHVHIINTCIEKLTATGTLFFSTNFSKFKIQTEAIKGIVKDITKLTTPFDFEKKLDRYCYKITKE